MYDSNVRFDKILHIPTLCASISNRVSDDFQEFLGDAYEEKQSADLLAQCPTLERTLKEIRENDEIEAFAGEVAHDLYRESGDFEFLINLEIAFPFNFNFNEKGEYRSNSLGGRYIMQWILAKDMVNAAEIAIERATALWERECEKARKEQGLEGYTMLFDESLDNISAAKFAGLNGFRAKPSKTVAKNLRLKQQKQQQAAQGPYELSMTFCIDEVNSVVDEYREE